MKFASMGPRLESRGELPRRARELRWPCFNGAAARKPRRGFKKTCKPY